MRHSSLKTIALILLASACTVATACSSSTADGTGTSSDDLSASQRGGMGASLYDGGVSFRLWAPRARRVWVSGDFNGWSPDANELGNEFNGNFSTDVPGAQRWQKYKYFIEGADGSRFWKADPRAARMENSSGSSIVHDPAAYRWNSDFRAPPANEMVIYEMHVGTFAQDFGKGTWKAALQKLDYLADLGVNMIEMMPVSEFPGDQSWGYNPAQLMAPESSYGTPEDLKAFIDGAHQRGIGVLVDVVMNHWGPNDLPHWCHDGDCRGNGGSYFYNDDRAQTPWGHTRPDYGRSEVRSYIRDTIMMWLHEYRIDGLRWDGTKWIRTKSGDGSGDIPDGWSLMQWINANDSQPWKMKIAEDFGGGEWMTKSPGEGGAGFNTQWDGSFVHPIRKAVIESDDGSRSMAAVKGAITHKFNGQATQRVIYTESHDEVANGQSRVPEMIWPGNAAGWAAKKRSTLAAAITFTSPGIPMIFQGQEFLEDGFFQAEDALDWGKAHNHNGITQLYRDLAKARRNFSNNTRGLRGDNVNVHHVNEATKVIAYHRWDRGGNGDDVVVVANFSGNRYQDYRVGMPNWGMWKVRVNTDWNGYSGDFGNTQTLDTDAAGGGQDGMPQSASFQIGPYSAVIFSQ